MAKVLNLDELLDVAKAINPRVAKYLERQLLQTASRLADLVADRYEILRDQVRNEDKSILVGFYPRSDKQRCPSRINQCDKIGLWRAESCSEERDDLKSH